MAESARPTITECHSSYPGTSTAVPSRYEGEITVPADVIVNLAHTVISVLQAENATLQSENMRLRGELARASALLRPRNSVLQ
jgi:hypothetical protein